MAEGNNVTSVTYTKIRMIQRRLAWPLRKDDTQIREAFHIFVLLMLRSIARPNRSGALEACRTKI